MAIVEVSQATFGLFKGMERCRPLWTEAHEQAWFSDASGAVAGVLMLDPVTGLWGWNICRLSEDGHHKRVAHAADFASADMARLDLVAQMRKTA